jgi:hypothetical protein
VSGGPELIADAWTSYAESVLPAAAGHGQRQECRRAFYAGAQSMLSLLFMLGDADADPDAEPSAAEIEIVELLQAELGRFAEDVFGGRA